jgi:hypothetical protein
MSLRAAIAPEISQFSLLGIRAFVRNWRSTFNRLIPGAPCFLCVNVRLGDCADLYICTIGNASITGNAIAQEYLL